MLGTSRPRVGGGAEANRIGKRLQTHHQRMTELMEAGLPRAGASRQAYLEIMGYDATLPLRSKASTNEEQDIQPSVLGEGNQGGSGGPQEQRRVDMTTTKTITTFDDAVLALAEDKQAHPKESWGRVEKRVQKLWAGTTVLNGDEAVAAAQKLLKEPKAKKAPKANTTPAPTEVTGATNVDATVQKEQDKADATPAPTPAPAAETPKADKPLTERPTTPKATKPAPKAKPKPEKKANVRADGKPRGGTMEMRRVTIKAALAGEKVKLAELIARVEKKGLAISPGTAEVVRYESVATVRALIDMGWKLTDNKGNPVTSI